MTKDEALRLAFDALHVSLDHVISEAQEAEVNLHCGPAAIRERWEVVRNHRKAFAAVRDALENPESQPERKPEAPHFDETHQALKHLSDIEFIFGRNGSMIQLREAIEKMNLAWNLDYAKIEAALLAERESCEKLCADQAKLEIGDRDPLGPFSQFDAGKIVMAEYLAQAIRARSVK